MGHTPVPLYTNHFQPSSSGTVLAGQHPSLAHSGMSGMHIGSMISSKGGLDRISSQGANQCPVPRWHLHPMASSHKTLHPGISSSHMHLPLVPLVGDAQVAPPGKTHPMTHHKILPDRLNPHHTSKTHAKISPIVTTLPAPSALTTHKQSSTKHHIIDILCCRSSSK